MARGGGQRLRARSNQGHTDSYTRRTVHDEMRGSVVPPIDCQSTDHTFMLPDPGPQDRDRRLAGTDLRLVDFWTWAYSDIAVNTVRPILVEFLVADALGDTRPVRTEWANFDIETPDGIRVEVKSSAYLQRWPQRRLSMIRFDRLAGRFVDPQTQELADAPTVRADVFVFAVQTATDPARYDAFDVAQWDFYVVGADRVEAHGTRSVGLAWVCATAGRPVTLAELRDAVARAHAGCRKGTPMTPTASTSLPEP